MLNIKQLFSKLRCEKNYLKNKKKIATKYYKVFNRKLDFNYVDTFSAYLQHIKIDKNSEELWPLVDKLAVRSHVANLIGENYLNNLLGVWNNTKEIDYNILPSRYVLKTNHGTSCNIIVPDAQKLNQKAANKKLNGRLKKNYYDVTLEPHYRKIQPKIIAEEYLEDINGELLDYKFFCFHGEPYFIQVDIGRYTKEHSRIYFDLDWQPLPFTMKKPFSTRILQRPDNFDEMVKIVQILGKGYLHVRVDLYNVNGRILFGELTFTHESGFAKFYPDETYDFLIGDIIAKRKTLIDFRRSNEKVCVHEV